jgi:hypothetical protein
MSAVKPRPSIRHIASFCLPLGYILIIKYLCSFDPSCSLKIKSIFSSVASLFTVFTFINAVSDQEI